MTNVLAGVMVGFIRNDKVNLGAFIFACKDKPRIELIDAIEILAGACVIYSQIGVRVDR